jgi:hypothetical protein
MKINKLYLFNVLATIIFIPLVGSIIEVSVQHSIVTYELAGKWFVFSAVGLRLFIAGLRQIMKPEFTAKEIFHIQGDESLPIVRELGFANLCFGLIGIVSLFVPSWRVVSAFGSGLYYGLAALLHLIKKPAGPNEKFALITDVFVFFLLIAYFFNEVI